MIDIFRLGQELQASHSSAWRPGRPSTAAAIHKPVIRIATGNPNRGHRQVQGELVTLGHPYRDWRVESEHSRLSLTAS